MPMSRSSRLRKADSALAWLSEAAASAPTTSRWIARNGVSVDFLPVAGVISDRGQEVLRAVLLGVLAAMLLAVPAQAAFNPPTIVTGDDRGEPGIDVAGDGTIYVNAPAGLLSNLPGSPSDVYRSTDGGATFTNTPKSLRANLPGGGDSDISIEPGTGKLFMTDLWLGSATVSTSTDKGQSWLANPLQGVVVQDRQWIAAPGGDVSYHATHQIPLGLVVSKSQGGLAYPISTVAATPVDQTGCICPPGNLIAQSGGGPLGLSDKVGLIYATSTGGVKFAQSTNGGLTFANVDIAPASSATTNANFPVVANAGSNKLVAVWQEVVGNGTRIRFSSSSNWGASWAAPKTIVSAGTSVYPWVDARGSKVSVTLYHTDAAGTPEAVPAGAQWFESYLESTDGGSTFSGLETVDSTPAKTGPICTEGINCSEGRDLLDFQSVALDPQNRANATWTHVITNGSDTELRFARQP